MKFADELKPLSKEVRVVRATIYEANGERKRMRGKNPRYFIGDRHGLGVFLGTHVFRRKGDGWGAHAAEGNYALVETGIVTFGEPERREPKAVAA
jgi:hypothetical protein